MTTTAPRSRYFVRAGEVPGYHPANHVGTVNRRIIGRENVGARQLEVVLGEIQKGKGALPHAHPGIEQVCYMIQGRARAEVGGEAYAISVAGPRYRMEARIEEIAAMLRAACLSLEPQHQTQTPFRTESPR